MSKHLLKRVIVVLLLAAAIAATIYVGGGYRARDRNMARAEAHIPRLEAAIAGDARFAGIEFGRDYRGAGGLRIVGALDSEADWRALHELLIRSEPPTEQILYSVTIGDDPVRRRAPAPPVQRTPEAD